MFTNRTSLVLFLWMFATAILAYVFGGLVHSKWLAFLLSIASAIAFVVWLFWRWRERPHRDKVVAGIYSQRNQVIPGLRDWIGFVAARLVLIALVWQIFTLVMAVIVLRGLPGEPCFCSNRQGTSLVWVLPWVSLGLFYTEFQVWGIYVMAYLQLTYHE